MCKSSLERLAEKALMYGTTNFGKDQIRRVPSLNMKLVGETEGAALARAAS